MKKMTIGVILDWLKPQYQYNIVQGIQDEAEKHQFNLLYYLGTQLKAYDYYHEKHHIVYENIAVKHLDYIIIFAGVFHNLTDAAKMEFIKKLYPVPIITISFKLKDFPAIMIDNRTGLRALINHIIEKHQRRKLVFIAGPDYNSDSNERYRVYKDVLARHKIPLNEELVVTNTRFSTEAGRRAIKLLINERRLLPGKDFDGIIAANDSLAFGVNDILLQHNISIPEEVILTGFDDTDEAQFFNPPLSTVRQPLENVGRDAIKWIAGEYRETPVIYKPTQMVIRESCGCNPHLLTLPEDFTDALEKRGKNKHPEKSYPIVKKQIKKMIAPLLETKIALNLTERFIQAFIHSYDDPDDKLFLDEFMEILLITEQMRGDINVWNPAIMVLKKWLSVAAPDNASDSDISMMLEQGNSFIGQVIKKREIKERIDAEIYNSHFRAFEEAIKINLELDQLLNEIKIRLNDLGFSHYYIFFFNRPGVFNHDFKLVLSSRNQDMAQIDSDNTDDTYFENFDVIYTQLLATVEPPYYFCILPLVENEDSFGFIILEIIKNYHTQSIYSDIAAQISGSLKSLTMLKEIKNAYQKLEETRVELEKELHVAQDIQKSLLPEQLYHKDFDMAAKMITTVSVGGDYYDLIHTEDKSWILIGDVSGHGVHAGLVMMMVHTSIHLLLKLKPNITPSELLTTINDVVTENIRRLGDLKFMTIIVLCYEGKGKFIFSGMHLPLLIYRKATGRVHSLETNGLWLGISKNINGLNTDARFVLQKGDCLLLYTDGVTEAEHKKKRKQLYSDNRLQEVFFRVAEKSCGEIIDTIIEDLADFSFDDDITLFALKRL